MTNINKKIESVCKEFGAETCDLFDVLDSKKKDYSALLEKALKLADQYSKLKKENAELLDDNKRLRTSVHNLYEDVKRKCGEFALAVDEKESIGTLKKIFSYYLKD